MLRSLDEIERLMNQSKRRLEEAIEKQEQLLQQINSVSALMFDNREMSWDRDLTPLIDQLNLNHKYIVAAVMLMNQLNQGRGLPMQALPKRPNLPLVNIRDVAARRLRMRPQSV